MVIRREEVLRLVRELPEEVDVDELIHRLYLRQKLAAAEADVAAGRTLSVEEVRRQSLEWPR
jgi:hypothetical protein